jgi:hypothetical protein
MPGIYGGLGCKQELYEVLKNSFKSMWGKCESINLSCGQIGGHAFSGDSAIFSNSEGVTFAVDGEHSLYKYASEYAGRQESSFFRLKDDGLYLGVNCKGNVALFDQDYQILHLATEWTGSFPLYYTKVDEGILFSSHLRPLSKAICAKPDPVGVIQFLKFGFILAGRTFFKDIKRLMPGQALTYKKANECLILYERSRAWREDEEEIEFDNLIENNWKTLGNTLKRCIKYSQHNALFSSSGWDSRLLLALFRQLDENGNIVCYTHGDLKSREIQIAKQIYEDTGISYHLEPIAGEMFDLHSLKRGFERTENVVFPHYHRAGYWLAKNGVDCASAGVLGEVIGGRHGRHWPMLPISEWDKIRFVTSHLLHLSKDRSNKNGEDIDCFYKFLNLEKIKKPWYLREEWWNLIPAVKDEMYADMEEFLIRLRKRGVENLEKLIEAYTAEYFGSQYLTTQLLSCRSDVNVAIPFADQELFYYTSGIPLRLKIVHSLQQALLLQYDSELLRYPNAAAFFNSKIPIPALEVSRVFRKLFESLSWKICRFTKGNYKPTPTGWSTFDCLGKSQALLIIADSLKCGLFNKDIIHERLFNGVMQTKPHKSMYTWNAAQNQIMKIYTTDLMLH